MIKKIIQKIKDRLNWIKLKIKKVLISLGIIGIVMAAGNSAIPVENTYKNIPLTTEIRQEFVERGLNFISEPIEATYVIKGSWAFSDEIISITPTKWQGEFHVGNINYQDRETKEFKPIDIKFREENGEFIVDKASYEIRIPKKLGKVRFWANEKDLDIEPIGIKPDIEGRITDDPETSHKGNTVRFDNVYGQGIHLEFVCRTGSVKKYIVFDQKPTKFDWQFKLTGFDKNKHIIWKPRIFDSNGKTQDVEYDIKGGILTKHLSEEFFDNAVYPVRTDTTTSYYAGAGDGTIYTVGDGQPSQAIWDTVHDATTGTGRTVAGVSGYASEVWIRGVNNDIKIFRAFFPVDTSGLPNSAIISGAILKLNLSAIQDGYNGDGYDYVAIVQTDQPDPTTLEETDYNNCGATDNPTKGSANIDITGLTTEQYNNFTLDATGLTWVSKTGWTMLGIRPGQDIQDYFPGDPGEVNKFSGVSAYFSEYTDTASDPYLEVTYTVGGRRIMITQ